MKPTREIPKHLKRFTLKQNYNLYTPIDHAGWRFIMNLSKDFFKDHAHAKYLSGLPATGISTDRIPRIDEMDKCLKKLGWRAAVVSGFIPPAVFLEFLSLGILPIACDMRNFGHLHYTPAPDIVHEAAGHAPILADPEYANYIRRYGEISQKVIFSAEDLAVYNAIRKLSDLKEDVRATEAEIAEANQELNEAVHANTTVSEATQLSRMAWWTIEYGLVGSMENPLIYGAGLLSSVGESYDCFVKNVKKLPLTLDCINTSYDITKPQPHLFVTPNFQHLADVLEEFSHTMAYKIGPQKGLAKALKARTVTTCQWNQDLQVSGILDRVDFDAWGRPSVLKWRGFCQLSYRGQEIKNFGPKKFSGGLVAIVGPPESSRIFTRVLKTLKVSSRDMVELKFESGIKITGRVKNLVKVDGVTKAVIFEEVTSSQGEKFKQVLVPTTDKLEQVFGEAADRASYYAVVPFMHAPKASQKSNLTKENKGLNELYAIVRNLRNQKTLGKAQLASLEKIHGELTSRYTFDWLLKMEILELLSLKSKAGSFSNQLKQELKDMQKLLPDQKDMIDRGLKLFA